jgi:hypothetical protein
MSWLEGYDFRVKIPCSPTAAGAQTGYQKKVSIVKGTGQNSAGVIYLKNNARNWPNDVRFTKDDGETLLDFYRAEYDATDGTWYVELDSIAASVDTDFYLYYGKASDSDASDGPGTFLFFDDFELGDLSRWDSAVGWGVLSGVPTGEGQYVGYTELRSGRVISKSLSAGSVKFVFKCLTTNVWAEFAMLQPRAGDSYISALGMLPRTGGGAVPPKFKYYPGGSWTTLPTDTEWSEQVYYQAEVVLDFQNGLFRWTIDGADKGTATLKDTAGNDLDSSYSLSEIRFVGGFTGGYGQIDQLMVTKFAYPEPAWATPGATEEAPIPPIVVENYEREGIYWIRRNEAVAIGAAKTLHCYSYNHAEAAVPLLNGAGRREFAPSWSWHPVGSGYWSWLPTQYFLQNNQMSYLTAYRADGRAILTFGDIGGSEHDTITKISIYAYCRGANKTVMSLQDEEFNVFYYEGEEKSDSWIFDWNVKEYTLNPRTGVAWTWQDIQPYFFGAGVWLKSSGMDWDEMVAPKAACRYLYVVVDHTFEWEDFYLESSDVLWPMGYKESALSPFVGNILYGTYPHAWDGYSYPIIVRHAEKGANNELYYTKIKDLAPTGETINSLKLTVIVEDTNPAQQFKPFVKIEATYYYGTEFSNNTSTPTTNIFTWATNPATGNAWTNAELAAATIGYILSSGSKFPIRTMFFAPTINYGSPAVDLVAACVSMGPGQAILRIPKLEACLNRYGPHELGCNTEHEMNQLLTKHFSYPVVTKPAPSATIDFLKVYYKAGGVWPGYATGEHIEAYYKPFIEFPQEEFYYGTARVRPGRGPPSASAIGAEYSDTWNTNPKTGQAWTYADLQDLKFGVCWYFVPEGASDLEYGAFVQTYIIKLEIGYNSGSTALTDAANDPLWGAPILFTCDLAELPPRGSTVNSITLNYDFGGVAGIGTVAYISESAPAESVCTMAAWIYQNGVYYFDDDIYVGDPFSHKTGAKTWDLNPATGLAWTYEDLSACKFGAILRNSNASGAASVQTYGHINRLDLSISYNEAVATDPISYEKVGGRIDILSFERSQQNPISPDCLRFSSDTYFPERAEIAFFQKGLRFHGIVTGINEVTNGTAHEYNILAESQSVMLEYRYIPTYNYSPQLDYFDQVLTIRDQFSAAIPIYPFAQNSAKQDYDIAVGDVSWQEGGVDLTQVHQTRLGILWLLNSMVPPGVATSQNAHVAKLANFLNYVRGRALFTTNHSPSPMPNGYNDLRLLSATPTYDHYMYGDRQTRPDYIGGVHRLARGKSIGLLNPGEYIVQGNDIYYHTGGLPDNLMLCIDGWADTFIRPGTWELADYFLNVANSFSGQASKTFDLFFERLGQEVQFRNSLDGYVYLDAATEISRGSEASPLMSFIHGEENCSSVIRKESNGLQPNAVVALESSSKNARAATDWKKPLGLWTSKHLSDSSRSSSDLGDYVEALLGEDKDLYEVSKLAEIYELLPGDWIAVAPKKEGLRSVRIQSIVVTPGRTKIVCGKQIHTISEKFGEWRDALGTADLTKKFQSKEFSFTGASGNSSFVIAALKSVDWSCRLSISLETAAGTAPQSLVYRVALNGKVIPPGRWKVLENAGSIEIDISEYCSKSTTSDTTNTINVYLAGGTAANTTTCRIDQFKNLKELSNA